MAKTEIGTVVYSGREDRLDWHYLLRLRLFWYKTISGNDFTPYCVFGYAWKIKFSGKAFQLTVFYGFDLEIGLHFYFYYKPFPGPRRAKRGRGREKEERVTDPPKTDCTPAPVPAYISHHHRDRITTEDRST